MSLNCVFEIYFLYQFDKFQDAELNKYNVGEEIAMAEVKKLRCTEKTKSLEELSKLLKADLYSEVVCEEKMLNDRVVLLCFEQFYFRCSSYVALSVMLTESEECQEVVVVGFGGGDGLANISWGANKSFANKVVKILSKLDFVEVS